MFNQNSFKPYTYTLSCYNCLTKLTTEAFPLVISNYPNNYRHGLKTITDKIKILDNYKSSECCFCTHSDVLCTYCGQVVGLSIVELCIGCNKTEVAQFKCLMDFYKVNT